MSQKEKAVKGHHFNDLTGKRFGFLTAIKPTSERSGNNIKWECLCDCGKTVLVASNHLICGNTKSCGCYKKSGKPYVGKSQKDLSGMRFGRLTVLNKTEYKAKDGCVIWRCLCDCGKIANVSAHLLISGRKKSCGCKARFDSSTGVKGVYKKRDKYCAALTFMGERHIRYGFTSIESAKKAREQMYEEIVIPYLNSLEQKTE